MDFHIVHIVYFDTCHQFVYIQINTRHFESLYQLSLPSDKNTSYLASDLINASSAIL